MDDIVTAFPPSSGCEAPNNGTEYSSQADLGRTSISSCKFLFLQLNIHKFTSFRTDMGLPSDEDRAKMAAFGLHSKPHLSS